MKSEDMLLVFLFWFKLEQERVNLFLNVYEMLAQPGTLLL